MIGLLGKKVGMTQVFDDEGRQVPVTVLRCGPCYVTGIRTEEKDGYSAVQLGFGDAKEKNTTKPKLAQLKKAGVNKPLHLIREIRTDVTEGLQLGAELRVNQFEAGDVVDVTGTSKGRGFQGVVKRHKFKGGEKAHGTKFGRQPGSIGQSATPARVQKNTRLPGQMGNEILTQQNVKVVQVDEENGLLVVKGGISGAPNGYVVIRTALKKGPRRPWKIESKQEENVPQSAKADEAPAEAPKSEASPAEKQPDKSDATQSGE